MELRAGTLYTALNRLRAEKLIEAERGVIVDSRLRLAEEAAPLALQRPCRAVAAGCKRRTGDTMTKVGRLSAL